MCGCVSVSALCTGQFFALTFKYTVHGWFLKCSHVGGDIDLTISTACFLGMYRPLTLHFGGPWKHLHRLLQHNVLYLLAFFSLNLFPKVIEINKVELWTLLQDSSRFYVLQVQAVISPLLRIYGWGIPAEINYITYRGIPQKFTVHEKLNMHGLHLYRLIKL